MTAAIDSVSIKNHNPNLALFMNRPSITFYASPQLLSSLRFKSLHCQARSCKVTFDSRCLNRIPKGFCSVNNSVVAFAVSHEDSHSEIEEEKEKSSLGAEAEESQEAWKEALASFQEQALMMQSVSQEAYEVYSKKAKEILKETADQLKIQADKAKHDLTVITREISEEGQAYLSTATEQSPEPVKDIVETFSSAKDELKDITKVQDFHLGIPYGAILALSGFLSFMITGSISAIRFGVILGGTLMALSISSLRSQKRGESFSLSLKLQAAIASIIFLRHLHLLSKGGSFIGSFVTIISGAMVAFYVYRITSKDKLAEG